MESAAPRELPAGHLEWAIQRAAQGAGADELLQPLVDAGWDPAVASDALDAGMRAYLESHARANDLPMPVRVPSPVAANDRAILALPDREVQVVASLLSPRIVVFAGLLSADECQRFIALARPGLQRSATLDLDTGRDEAHHARTSHGMFLQRGQDDLCRRVEARIAALLDWPVENGEGLQVLRYGPGAEYRPHHDYFDPARAGTAHTLSRGGQRVASLVMYLNTPECGGATVFPDVGLEVSAVAGNAVFFSYDRPHPMTRTLHGGAPVRAGEKWVLTKWLREAAHH
jgi:prolyl 4-hydroxylase